MKPEVFFTPGALRVERLTPREGPSPVFNAWKPNTAQSFTTEKDLLKFVAWPKSTPTGQAIREWLEQHRTATPTEAKLDVARMKAEGFGPEAHDEPDPTTNTKMVT